MWTEKKEVKLEQYPTFYKKNKKNKALYFKMDVFHKLLPLCIFVNAVLISLEMREFNLIIY